MNPDTDFMRPSDGEPRTNAVFVDHDRVHARHSKLLNRFVRRAVPFAFGFYHIETNYKLRIIFEPLRTGCRGSFGYPRFNSHRELVIRLSNSCRHMPRLFPVFFHEMTHYWQFLNGRADPRNIAYYSRGMFVKDAYMNDPQEVEAREMALVMTDHYQRYVSNYRWNVPCDIHVKGEGRQFRVTDKRFPQTPCQVTFCPSV